MAESQGPTVVAVAVAFGVLCVFVLSLRIFARFLLVKSIGADDALIVVAALLSWAFMAVTIVAVQHGLGSHFLSDVMPRGIDNLVAYSQVVWLSSIFYNACIGFIKLSVLALYMRIGDRLLRRLAIVMTGVIVCQAGGNVLACIFQCTPISAAYDVTILDADKKCINVNAFYLANAAVNIFTDLLTYSLPFKMVWQLQLPRSQKISLAIILGLGLFACISSIVRITFIPQMLTSDDPTWAISGAMYWSVIEINIGILAASIPSYKTIAKKYAPRLLGSSGGPNSKSQSGTKMSVFFSKKGSEGPTRLDSLDRSGTRYGYQSHIEHGADDNSSEEALYLPGRINVTTEVSTKFNKSIDDEPKSIIEPNKAVVK